MDLNESRMSYIPLIDIKSNIYCHLLLFNGIKLIINCGIGDNFDFSIYTDEIKKAILSADAILITSFNLNHFGAIGLFPESKVFCTVPTALLGKIMLDNANAKIGNICTNFNLTMIKYAEPFNVNDIQVVGFNAGSVVGNTLFKISSQGGVLAVGYNICHQSELYLNGIKDYFKTDVFVTNSGYSEIEPCTLLQRNEIFKAMIDKSSDKRVILIISVTRLVELLLTIKSNVCVVSNCNILDRIKSMIEWAGTFNYELFDFTVPFTKMGQSTYQYVIFISDYANDVYLGRMIEKIRQEDFILINLTNNEHQEIRVYDISYKIVIKESLVNENSVNQSAGDNSILNVNWYDNADTLILKKDQFSFFKKNEVNVALDDYGLLFNNEYEISNDDADKLSYELNDQMMELETIKDTGRTVKINWDVCDKNLFVGIADLNSLKEIISKFKPQYLISTDPSDINMNLMTSFMSIDVASIHKAVNEVSIVIRQSKIDTCKLSEEVISSKFLLLENERILCEPLVKKDSIIELNRKEKFLNKKITLAKIDRLVLEKNLQKNGYLVKKGGKSLLIVDDSVYIRFCPNKIIINSKNDIKTAISIREIIYNYLIIYD